MTRTLCEAGNNKVGTRPDERAIAPRHAPNASDHHNGMIFSAPPKVGAMDLIIGIMVATNGMLSTRGLSMCLA